LERERHVRADTEKAKRKLEGELRIAQENLDELSKQRQDAENSLRRKESELYSINVKLEDAQSQAAKLQRLMKENEARIKGKSLKSFFPFYYLIYRFGIGS
jgi:myosin protein heavy chain